MNAVFLAAGIILLPVAVGLSLRFLSKPKRAQLVKPETISALREEVDRLKMEAAQMPFVLALIRQAGYFIGKSATALDFDQQVRARLHANLAIMSLLWADTVIADEDLVDTPKMTTTSRLTLGLTLLKDMKLELANEEFTTVWLDTQAHLNAKRVAIMGLVWILATRGRHQDAAEEEQLLMLLPTAAKLGHVSYSLS